MAFTYNLTVNFPNNSAAEVQAMAVEIAAYLGWTATIENGEGAPIPNPISAAEYVRRAVAKYLREALKAKRAQDAESARLANIQVVTDLNIN